MNVFDPQNDGWKPCNDGELRQLVGQLRRRRLQKKLRPIAASAAALLLLTMGIVLSKSPVEPPVAAAMSCKQAVEILPKYVARELDPAKDAQLTEHLEHCAHCREMAERLRSHEQHPNQPQSRLDPPAQHAPEQLVATADPRF